MRESIGDIIYILVMVIALVYSIIAKAKKVEHEAPVVPHRDKVDDDENYYPTFNEWLTGEKEIEVVTDPTPPIPKKEPYKRRSSLDDYQHLKQDKPQKGWKNPPHTPPNVVSKRLSTIEDEEFEEVVLFKDPHDLRKAIIYSEILKRPSF